MILRGVYLREIYDVRWDYFYLSDSENTSKRDLINPVSNLKRTLLCIFQILVIFLNAHRCLLSTGDNCCFYRKLKRIKPLAKLLSNFNDETRGSSYFPG